MLFEDICMAARSQDTEKLSALKNQFDTLDQKKTLYLKPYNKTIEITPLGELAASQEDKAVALLLQFNCDPYYAVMSYLKYNACVKALELLEKYSHQFLTPTADRFYKILIELAYYNHYADINHLFSKYTCKLSLDGLTKNIVKENEYDIYLKIRKNTNIFEKYRFDHLIFLINSLLLEKVEFTIAALPQFCARLNRDKNALKKIAIVIPNIRLLQCLTDNNIGNNYNQQLLHLLLIHNPDLAEQYINNLTVLNIIFTNFSSQVDKEDFLSRLNPILKKNNTIQLLKLKQIQDQDRDPINIFLFDILRFNTTIIEVESNYTIGMGCVSYLQANQALWQQPDIYCLDNLISHDFDQSIDKIAAAKYFLTQATFARNTKEQTKLEKLVTLGSHLIKAYTDALFAPLIITEFTNCVMTLISIYQELGKTDSQWQLLQLGLKQLPNEKKLLEATTIFINSYLTDLDAALRSEPQETEKEALLQEKFNFILHALLPNTIKNNDLKLANKLVLELLGEPNMLNCEQELVTDSLAESVENIVDFVTQHTNNQRYRFFMPLGTKFSPENTKLDSPIKAHASQ